jgi:Leucine-rich repeat (LRR) protein
MFQTDPDAYIEINGQSFFGALQDISVELLGAWVSNGSIIDWSSSWLYSDPGFLICANGTRFSSPFNIHGCPAERQRVFSEDWLFSVELNPPNYNGFAHLCQGYNIVSQDLPNTLNPNAISVVLKNNSLTFLPAGLFRYPGMSTLQMPYLQFIDLSENALTSIQAGTFCNMQSLNQIDLSWNHLMMIEVGAVDNVPRLVGIDLSHNALSYLPSDLSNYNSHVDYEYRGNIDVSFNSLVSIPTFTDFPNLAFVELNNNQLTSLQVGSFSYLSSLVNLDISNNLLTALRAGVFNIVPALGVLNVMNNRLTWIDAAAFVGLTSLTELSIAYNLLSFLSVNTFVDNVLLNVIDITNNHLTSLEVGIFSNLRSLQHVSLAQNFLAALSPGLFADLLSLEELALDSNSITILRAGVLNNLTALQFMQITDNTELTAIEPGAFDGMNALSGVYLRNSAITSIPGALLRGINVTTFSIQNSGVLSISPEFLERAQWVQSLALAPNPLVCYRIAPGQPIECTACVLGYVFDDSHGSPSCVLPPFGPAPSVHWSTTNINSTFGTPDMPVTLFVGSSYSEPAPPLVPQLTAFAGYRGDFDAIEYKATFSSSHIEVNMSCGMVVSGTTGNAPPSVHRFYETHASCSAQDVTRGECAPGAYAYDSPEVYYTFEVGPGGGVFTFDSCLSAFSTSLAIYRLDVTDNGNITSTLVFPTQPRTILVYVQVFTDFAMYMNMTRVFPYVGGCSPSLNARTPPINLTQPGLYSIGLQAGRIWDANSPAYRGAASGRYVLNMSCGTSNQTVPPAARRLGLQIDRTTGAASATPTVPGNYSFNLTAADGTGATSTIRQWAVRVEQPPRFQRTAVPFLFNPPIPTTAVLGLRWTYVFWPPIDSTDTSRYFSGARGSVTFSVTSASGQSVSTGIGDDLLISPASGLIQVVPQRIGAFTLRIVASDGARLIDVDNFARPWSFEVMPPDGAWNDINGPNGRGCGNGSAVESPSHNGSFTCDCTLAVGMSGANCDEVVVSSSGLMAASSSSNQSVIGGLLGAFLAVALVGYGWHRLRMRKRQWTPVNFSAESGKLLAELGIGPQFDIAADQLGFALTLSGLATDASSGHSVLMPGDENDLRETLSRALRGSRLLGVLNISIDWASAIVRLAVPERAEVAVVVQRPALDSNTMSANIGDRVLDKLHRAMQAGRLVVRQGQSGAVAVTSAALMVPRRVPREVNRKTVTRLGERLGEGVAAEVFKATITGRAGTGPPVLVASKEPRSEGNMTREDVEREAVLMAMLDHPNVLKLVGVVTVPRIMPALMLLE